LGSVICVTALRVERDRAAVHGVDQGDQAVDAGQVQDLLLLTLDGNDVHALRDPPLRRPVECRCGQIAITLAQ